jgi:hypothetical protein
VTRSARLPKLASKYSMRPRAGGFIRSANRSVIFLVGMGGFWLARSSVAGHFPG